MHLRERAPRRVLSIVVAACAALLTACGGAPDKAEFTAKIKDSLGSDLLAGMTAQGIDKDTTDRLIDTFISCQYDSIKDDADLLQKAYDNPGDVDIAQQLDLAAQKCIEDLTSGINEEADITTTTFPAAETAPDVSVPDSTVDTIVDTSVVEDSVVEDSVVEDSVVETTAPETTAP